MKNKSSFKPELIAPCGMNCGICLGHLREKNRCLGCREMSEGKPDSCRKCVIMHCKILKENKMLFCSRKCEKYPCTRLKNLDKRYRSKYAMSMLDNLEMIKKEGVRKFLQAQRKKYTCPKCGGAICVHRQRCLKCDKKKD